MKLHSLTIFVFTQILGLVAGLEIFLNASQLFFILCVFLLFPGNFISANVVETLLWRKLDYFQLDLVEIPLMIVINGLVWALTALFFARIKRWL